MVEVNIDFDKRFESMVPPEATYGGIYVVFAFNGDAKKPVWSLLDVGQANNIYTRHLHHERKSQWEAFAKTNNRKLVIYTCELSNEHGYRDIAEAALLYTFQPLCPTDGKDGYHHGDVKISVDGHLKNAFGSFVLHNTDR